MLQLHTATIALGLDYVNPTSDSRCLIVSCLQTLLGVADGSHVAVTRHFSLLMGLVGMRM